MVSLGDDLHLIQDDYNEPLVFVLLAILFPEVLFDLNDSEEDELVSVDQGVEVASQENKTDCDLTIIEEQAVPAREKEIMMRFIAGLFWVSFFGFSGLFFT